MSIFSNNYTNVTAKFLHSAGSFDRIRLEEAFSLIGAYNGGKCYMTTIKEIAKACNVSVATVSNVFTGKGRVSEERRQFILQTAKR
ncbi:hypothetical protein IMSAG025_01624 [Muribaculaceae bacterium]|jgi:transcriptional regulator with XRE-family HTH domain|nr:hypothetical protein IMSAG025_01624 [Muribaculaceae bacterium]